MIDVRTARAVDHSCQLYSYHSPRVVRTQGHPGRLAKAEAQRAVDWFRAAP